MTHVFQIAQVTKLETVEVRENQLQQLKLKRVPTFQSSEHLRTFKQSKLCSFKYHQKLIMK